MVGRLPFYNKDHDVLFQLIVVADVKFPRTMSFEAKDLLSGLLVKDPTKRLGGGPDDAKAIMVHPFFSCISWKDLEQKKVGFIVVLWRYLSVFLVCVCVQIPPPFKPQVTSDTDTKYFDSEFTGESVELTPPDNAGGPLRAIQEEPYFPQFSFQVNCC